MLLGIVTLSAQDQVLSLQQGTLRDWTMQKDTMMKISAAMPVEKYTFKATPPERNFGEQVLHGRLGRERAEVQGRRGDACQRRQTISRTRHGVHAQR